MKNLRDYRGDQISTGFPTLLRGLFVELPEPGTEWPTERREAWINCARAIFNSLYLDSTEANRPAGPVPSKEQSASTASSSPSHPSS